jgi:hypothetical protein
MSTEKIQQEIGELRQEVRRIWEAIKGPCPEQKRGILDLTVFYTDGLGNRQSLKHNFDAHLVKHSEGPGLLPEAFVDMTLDQARRLHVWLGEYLAKHNLQH